MIRALSLIAAVLAGGSMAVQGPERAAVLDAARPAAEQELGKPVRFVVKRLRVEGRWAFLFAGMQDEAGRPVDYAGTSRAEAQAHHLVSKDYEALLSHSPEGWSVVASAVGPTDAVWAEWPTVYGAPQAVVRP